MDEPNGQAPVAVFEGERLLFHWANDAWLAEWQRYTGFPPPAPGTPYAELATGKDEREAALRALRDNRSVAITYRTAYGFGVLTFVPVFGGRAVASHWTAAVPTARPARARRERQPDRPRRVPTAH